MGYKICHVTSVHPHTDVRIFKKECRSLSKKYEVVLIAPNVDDQVIDDVHVYGVKLPEGRANRIKSLSRVYDKMVDVDADVYHFHDPELMKLGVKIKREKHKRIIFDSHEDVPQQILCKEWIPRLFRKPLSFVYGKYEKSKLQKYDALVSVTPAIVERLNRINPYTYQVTNYPALTKVEGERTWGKSVCFTGGVSEQYLHHEIISILQQTDANYILAGPCQISNYMEKLKSLHGWDRVDYRGVVPNEECYRIMQSSSAGLALLFYSPNVGYKRGTLGVLKIFEYMMVGIPVICTDFDLWKEIVEGNNCGICVNPYDSREIVKAINYLMDNKDVAIKMGDNGREAVRKFYNWESQEKILFEMYETVLKR